MDLIFLFSTIGDFSLSPEIIPSRLPFVPNSLLHSMLFNSNGRQYAQRKSNFFLVFYLIPSGESCMDKFKTLADFLYVILNIKIRNRVCMYSRKCTYVVKLMLVALVEDSTK